MNTPEPWNGFTAVSRKLENVAHQMARAGHVRRLNPRAKPGQRVLVQTTPDYDALQSVRRNLARTAEHAAKSLVFRLRDAGWDPELSWRDLA